MNTRLTIFASLILAASLTSSAGAADMSAQQARELQQQIDALEARLQALEARIDRGVPLNKALRVEPKPGGWRNAANWGLLADGMTDVEVQRILGEPQNRRSVRKFEYWEYGDGKARLYMNRLKSWEIPSQAEP